MARPRPRPVVSCGTEGLAIRPIPSLQLGPWCGEWLPRGVPGIGRQVALTAVPFELSSPRVTCSHWGACSSQSRGISSPSWGVLGRHPGPQPLLGTWSRRAFQPLDGRP